MHTTGPNQGSGESRIRQRTVDTHRMDQSTNKFSEKYILIWVLASVCPTIGSQSGYSPAKTSHFCSDTALTWQKERILIFFQDHYSSFLLNYRQHSQNSDIYGFFQDHFNSFQDHCTNHHKSNILASIPSKPSQNMFQPFKFKFSNLIASIMPIVHPYGQIWQSVKNTHNSQ